MQKKNLLYICSGRGFVSNNLPRKIREVLNTFNRHCANVFVFSGDDIKENAKMNVKLKKNEMDYLRSNRYFGPAIVSVSEILDIIHDQKVFTFLYNKYSREKLDLIWERSSRLHCGGLRLARKLNIPYILEYKDHLLNYKISLLKWYGAVIEERKNHNARYIVVESNVLKDNFIKTYKKDNLVVAHNAANVEEFSPDKEKRVRIRNKLGINSSEVIIGYVGSYAFYHDSIRMIRAMSLVKMENLKLCLFGYGKDYDICKRLAIELGLLNRKIFMFPPVAQNQVPAIMNSFDIGLVPGTTDIICPIKVYEYMACELPVILPNYKCNKEVVTDFEEGILFEPKNETDLAKKLDWLAKNNEIRNKMGKAARKRILKEYTWEKTWGRAIDKIICNL